MPSCAVLCCVVLRYVMLCCVVLCCVCVVLCCAALCYVCVAFCCDVLCRAVPKVLLPKGKGRDVYPRVQVNGRSVCVARALCASVFTTAESGGMHWSPLLCPVLAAAGPVRRRHVRRPRLRCQGGGGVQPSLRSVGGASCAPCRPPPSLRPTRPTRISSAALLLWQGILQRQGILHSQGILLLSASLPRGSGQWPSCCTLPHCLGAMGSGAPAITLPHCLGAVGSGTPAVHCLTARGQSTLGPLCCSVV